MQYDASKAIIRLNKIEGQIKGIKNMIEKDRNYDDIIIQLSSINAAIKATARFIIDEHLKAVVIESIQSENSEKAVKNLSEMIDKFLKI